MLTKKVRFTNFYDKKNIKQINNRLRNFKKINFLKEYPFLVSYSKSYKYGYSKNYLSKLKKHKIFRIIAMGGSILGTEAIYQFLKKKIKKEFIFINNLNSKILPQKKAVNLIISKSGETLETISNTHIITNSSKSSKNLIITENKNSYLKNLAHRIKADVIEHKNYIGGRFSVLSEVGMLPAELMGLKESKFKKFNYLLKSKNFIKQLIFNVDSIIKLVNKNKNNSVVLNYDEKSENLFKWYQQLVGESLGKKSKGIIPIISSMPKDNHSLLQLYLDGPKKNFFTFFSVEDAVSDKISSKLVLSQKSYLKNSKLSKIVSAQRSATKNIFYKKKIPFRSFHVKKRDEESIGELFSFFVLETILLGRALKINPLDQPAVELIKVETKKILS